MSGDAEPLCDRISHIAAELENSAGDLRGMPGVSRLRAALPAAVAALRHIADQVLEQGVELDELKQLRAEREAADDPIEYRTWLNRTLRRAYRAGFEDRHYSAIAALGLASTNAEFLAQQYVTKTLAELEAAAAPQQPERGGKAPCNPECREAHAGQPH